MSQGASQMRIRLETVTKMTHDDYMNVMMCLIKLVQRLCSLPNRYYRKLIGVFKLLSVERIACILKQVALYA
jgi:hypothetical protein